MTVYDLTVRKEREILDLQDRRSRLTEEIRRLEDERLNPAPAPAPDLEQRPADSDRPPSRQIRLHNDTWQWYAALSTQHRVPIRLLIRLVLEAYKNGKLVGPILDVGAKDVGDAPVNAPLSTDGHVAGDQSRDVSEPDDG